MLLIAFHVIFRQILNYRFCAISSRELSVCATTTMSLTTWKSLACYVKQPQSQSLSLVLVVKEVFHFAQILIGKQVYGKPPQLKMTASIMYNVKVMPGMFLTMQLPGIRFEIQHND